MKGLRVLIQKHGFFVLLGLCLAVIAGSGLWAASMGGGGGEEDRSVSADLSTPPAEGARLTAPVPGETLRGFETWAFLDTLARWGCHEGMDLAAEKGFPVVVAKEGTVTAAFRDGAWGGVVEIDHGNGLATRYRGLAWPAQVRRGEAVEEGQTVGKVGTAPQEAAEAPHLHFEVLQDGVNQDPALFIREE